MRRVIFLVFLILMMTSSISAEEGYRLRVPTAEEYLTAMPQITAQMRIDDTSEYQRDTYELRRLMNEEFWLRYDDLSLVPFDILNTAEPYLDRIIGYDVDDHRTEPGWHSLLLNLWLKEHQPDLSTRDIWQFGDYILHIQPIDFTGDGVNELSVRFVRQLGDYVEYMVLQLDETQPEGYRRLGETNFWFSTRCAYQLSCGGEGELQQVRDLTGDGLPEWIVSRGSCGWGRCAVSLYVFGWWQEQFIDLTKVDQIWMPVVSGGGGASTYPPQGDWVFENIDDDPALEIKQIEYVTDNRGCEFSSEQVFKWDDATGQFRGREVIYEYADTPWCALRKAHDAMLDGNPEVAITHYERMLTIDPPPDLVDLWQYARIRLVAAYALRGQVEDARALLDEIDPEAIEDETIRSMAETAQVVFTADSDGKLLCIRLESAVSEAYDRGLPAPILLAYGQTNDYGVSWNYGGGDFSPANAGCSIYSLWERTVNVLREDQGLLKDQIETAGWNVVADFEFDINNDGINEILVWADLIGVAAFQSSDDGKVHYSTAQINHPTEYSQLAMIALPDGANLLVSLTFNLDIECQMDRNNQPGSVAVWRLEQGRLIHAGGQTICAPQTIDETFPNLGEMHLNSTLYGDNLVLNWDAEQLVFTLPSESHLTTESLTENPLSCYQGIYGFCGSLDNPNEALELIDVVLTTPQENTSPHFVTAFNYYRALALEALGRDGEALDEYIAIYEVAPESAWGMLAALHLEVIDGE
jgi:tetratricopeptide (TPR) repeat protein